MTASYTYENLADAELFGEELAQLPLLAVRRYWGTCPVCDLIAHLVLGEPPLCELCKTDLARARQHVALLRTSALRRQLMTDHPGELALLEARLDRLDRATNALDELTRTIR